MICISENETFGVPDRVHSVHVRLSDNKTASSFHGSLMFIAHPGHPVFFCRQFPTFGSLLTLIIYWSFQIHGMFCPEAFSSQNPKTPLRISRSQRTSKSMRRWHPKVSNHHHTHHPSSPLPSNLCWTEWMCARLALHQTLSASSRCVGPESLPQPIWSDMWLSIFLNEGIAYLEQVRRVSRKDSDVLVWASEDVKEGSNASKQMNKMTGDGEQLNSAEIIPKKYTWPKLWLKRIMNSSYPKLFGPNKPCTARNIIHNSGASATCRFSASVFSLKILGGHGAPQSRFEETKAESNQFRIA